MGLESGLDLPLNGGSGGTPSGTTQQDKQQFTVTNPAGQTIFTCTTIMANDGSDVHVNSAFKEFGYVRAGQVFTFAVAVPVGSIVTISGSKP